MTRAEYIVVMHHCHVKCTPEENKCKDCHWLKAYREIYGDEEFN